MYVHWAKYVHTGRIAVNIRASAFNKWVLAALEDPAKGINGVTIRDVYDYVMGNYTTISQAEVNANIGKFNKPIDARSTLAVYIQKQELCQEMAKDTHVPINEATMVNTGTEKDVATGGMDDVWSVWMWLTDDQQTWVRCKTMWSRAFLEKRELARLTGIAYNGMANQAADMEMGNTMVVALNNLANSAVHKNNTVEHYVISNSGLYAYLAARNTKIDLLLTVITNLSTGGGSSGGGYSGIDNVKATGTPWDPIGYCWTHGFKVCVGHSSATCNKCKDGYGAHLTTKRGDIQGGY